MLTACKKPFPTHRCGQCQYCRVLDRMDLVNRLKLEFMLRPYAYFITLTYDDLHMPHFSGNNELYKPDLVQWIDRIRRHLPKVTIFAVGEYGGKKFGSLKARRDIHPHYHVAIFSTESTIDEKIRAVAEKAWRFGHTHVLRLSSGLIDYITGYVGKKLTNTLSMLKVTGLGIRPEFTYRSRRPAIGDVTDQLISVFEEHGEITQINIDGKLVTLPKYLRHKLRDYFLRWDLDLKRKEDQDIYAQRKYEKKIENLQVMFDKEKEQMAEIEARPMAGDVYKKKSQIKKQITYNFETKLKRHTKGEKVL